MPRPPPPLNTLRAFEAAARHGSFASAGAELHVTAAAISHQVKQLEGRLERPLFRRLSRGVELTEAGRQYRDEIARALRQIEQATEALAQPRVDGPLRVSLPQSMAQLWLIPRLHRLTARYPGLELSVLGDNRLADLRDGTVDLALRFGQGHYPGLHVRELMGDAVSLLVASETLAGMASSRAGDIIARSVLLEDSWVGPQEPWMSWAPWLREVGMGLGQSTRKLQFSDSAMAVSACQSHTGVCIGRLSLVVELLQRRQLTALMPWRSTEYAHYLVMRPADQSNPRVVAFGSWLQSEIRLYVARAHAVSGFRLGTPESDAEPAV